MKAKILIILGHIVQQISVEPIGFMLYMTYGACNAATPTLMRVKVSRTYAEQIDINSTKEQHENYVKSMVVLWNVLSYIAELPLLVFTTVMAGGWNCSQ